MLAMATYPGDLATMAGGISGGPTGPEPNSRVKSTDSRTVSGIFCFRQLPSASVSVRHLPPATISTHTWALWATATFLGDRVVMSGGHIWSVWTMSRCLGGKMMMAGGDIR